MLLPLLIAGKGDSCGILRNTMMTVEACAVVATSLKLNNKKEKGESCCLSDTGQQFHYVSQFEDQACQPMKLLNWSL